MRFIQFIWLIAIGCFSVVCAEQITVTNEQSQPVYVALYEYNRLTGNANRMTQPQSIAANTTQKVTYPKIGRFKRISHSQLLVHTSQKKNLQEQVSKDLFNTYASVPVSGRDQLRVTEASPKRRVHDYVGVTNQTEQPWFVAMYQAPHAKDRSAQRFSSVYRLDSGSSVELPRPHATMSQRFTQDRIIFFHETKDALAESLSYRQQRALPYINAGIAQGTTFFLASDNDGGTRGYNVYAWKTRSISDLPKKGIKAIYNAVVDPKVREVRQQYETPDRNPAYGQVAQVRTEQKQPKQETAMLQQRETVIRNAIAQIIGRPLAESEPTPRIALVCSGGGFRAMFATLGTMRGAYERGVWDALSYVAGLSGSTWAIAPYMTSSQSLPDFVASARDRATQGFGRIYRDVSQSGTSLQAKLRHLLLKRLAFQQTLSLIDLYGFALGHYLLNGVAQKNGTEVPFDRITLTDQQGRIANGGDPLPLYTAVVGQSGQAQRRADYTWFFCSPYEVGANALGGHIPSWSFGRTFNGGQSTNDAPSYHIGYCMGIWGSAFSASLQDAYEMMLKDINVPLVQQIFRGLTDIRLGNRRMLPARVPNMTYNVPQAPYAARRYLSMIDGGYATNLPLAAVIPPERETADIIVMLDVSGGLTSRDGMQELKIAANYAQRQGVNMPNININQAYNNIASLHTRNAPDAPAIIYMPMIKNNNYSNDFDPRENLRQGGFLKTSNFFYSSDQAQQFMDLCAQNMRDAVPHVRKAIEHVLAQRQQTTMSPA